MAQLARRLKLGDAVVIGLGSMIGAGVFAVWAPAASAAGEGLLLGLAVAALVAFANAASSAQLAAAYPSSGGTYHYGREVLGPWWGFLAGWGFVVGKVASCAAMALTVAAYLAPPGWQRPVAALVVAGLTAVNLRGITRTALLTRMIVATVLVVLGLVVATNVVAIGSGTADPAGGGAAATPYGVLQSAGLLFFAFAGYARIATLGEEVVEPERTIPRAIVVAFVIALAVYALVGWSVLGVLGASGTAAARAPLAEAVVAAGAGWAEWVIRSGGGLAALGALLALVAGLGRTVLAMARHGDLPTWLDAVHPRFQVPNRAELSVAVIVVALVLLTDLRDAIGFSSFGVLLYYFVANLAAWRQVTHRRYPRWLQGIGLVGCLGLVVTLPPAAIVTGTVVFAVGICYRALVLRARRRARETNSDLDGL